MTDRITPDKLDRVSEVIVQLNKEMHPLEIKAVLIDPMLLKGAATDATRVQMLDELIAYIHSIASMVVEP